jgi:hypothetical protein
VLCVYTLRSGAAASQASKLLQVCSVHKNALTTYTRCFFGFGNLHESRHCSGTRVVLRG